MLPEKRRRGRAIRKQRREARETVEAFERFGMAATRASRALGHFASALAGAMAALGAVAIYGRIGHRYDEAGSRTTAEQYDVPVFTSRKGYLPHD